MIASGCGRVGFDEVTAGDCTGGDGTATANGHCYVVHFALVRWDAAVAACAAEGPTTHLATIDGAAENAVAFSLARTIPFDPVDTTNHRAIMWLGGNDLGTTTVWTWVTGEPFAYTNWRVNEPSSNNEHCLIMLGAEAGLWDNRACASTINPFAYLCERD